MNTSLWTGTLPAELIAFALGGLSAYLILSLLILIFVSLSRSSPTAGRGTTKYKPFLNSARHITDVKSSSGGMITRDHR